MKETFAFTMTRLLFSASDATNIELQRLELATPLTFATEKLQRP